jgi:hypothetical protein
MPAFSYEKFLQFVAARRAIFFRALKIQLNPEAIASEQTAVAPAVVAPEGAKIVIA